MDQFLQFAMNHWMLCVALVAILIALFLTEAGVQVGGVKAITPQEAVNLINHDNAVVVDIRNAEQFRKAQIIDSQNIPQTDLLKDSVKLDKYKNKPLIIVCANGNDSAKIAAKLKKQGFGQVVSIKNGITGWTMVDLPLISK